MPLAVVSWNWNNGPTEHGLGSSNYSGIECIYSYFLEHGPSLGAPSEQSSGSTGQHFRGVWADKSDHEKTGMKLLVDQGFGTQYAETYAINIYDSAGEPV